MLTSAVVMIGLALTGTLQMRVSHSPLGGFEMDLLTRLTKEPLPFATLLGIEIVSATEALRAPETNRNHSTQASSQKPRPAIFFA
jgi:hypothetical protein